MEGHLLMSRRERERLGPMERVARNEITLVEAAGQMGVCYRQAARILKRYREEGDGGLVHAARGRPSSRRSDPAYKEEVLDLVRTQYRDFGPTLASEKLLARDGKAVNRETLRLWMIEAGLRERRPSRSRHRTWRKRKASFGEMLQIDGSPHAWFEDRAPGCFLMDVVDDATGIGLGLFAPEETTWAAMDVLEAWVRRFGIPQSVYVDRKTVYVTGREPTMAEQLAGKPALTQFGRACDKLGIRIIEAHSPQAKGRVERKHGVYQDRLIKDMRLDQITGIEAGNAYLPGWMDQFNARFALAPRSEVDRHRPVPKGLDLRAVFCLEEERSLAADFTVRYQNRWLQVQYQKGAPKSGSRLTVQEWRDGSLHLLHADKELACLLLEERPSRPRPVVKKGEPRAPVKPAPDHPWRTPRTPFISPRQMPELINELADTYLGPAVITVAP